MRASRVRARFAQVTGEESETAFAEELLEEARISARTLVDLWHGPDEDLADRALRILVDLEELAVIPLAERAVEFEPTDRVEALQIAIEAEVALRQRVAAALEAMLDDLRPLPPRPRLAPTEVRPPPRRVCDEAYLQMRRLVHYGEDELEAMVAGDAFLNLPEDQRDAAIARARRSETWNRLVLGELEP